MTVFPDKHACRMLTATGTGLSVALSSPNWPWLFHPQGSHRAVGAQGQTLRIARRHGDDGSACEHAGGVHRYGHVVFSRAVIAQLTGSLSPHAATVPSEHTARL